MDNARVCQKCGKEARGGQIAELFRSGRNWCRECEDGARKPLELTDDGPALVPPMSEAERLLDRALNVALHEREQGVRWQSQLDQVQQELGGLQVELETLREELKRSQEHCARLDVTLAEREVELERYRLGGVSAGIREKAALLGPGPTR